MKKRIVLGIAALMWGALVVFSASASADSVYFKQGMRGDPSFGGTDSEWYDPGQGHYLKYSGDIWSDTYMLDMDFDGAGDLAVTLESSDTTGTLLIKSGPGGIGIDGGGKQDINKEEILSVSFDKEVTIDVLMLKMSEGSSISFKIGTGGWIVTLDEIVRDLNTALPAGETIQLKVTDSTSKDQFRVVAMGFQKNLQPEGNYIRIRTIQNGSVNNLNSAWMLRGKVYEDKHPTDPDKVYTGKFMYAEDVIEMIEESKPQVLERFVSGPMDPDEEIVPTRDGGYMKIADFLNACMAAGAPGCRINARVNLETSFYDVEVAGWDPQGRSPFIATLENLYEFPVDPPIRDLSLDCWGDFTDRHTEEEQIAMLESVTYSDQIGYEMKWNTIACNMIGGTKNSHDIIETTMFGVDHDTFMPKQAPIDYLRLNNSISELLLYIDFQSPMNAFLAQTDSDGDGVDDDAGIDIMADQLVEMARQQESMGYAMVWPLVQQFWVPENYSTSVDGKYAGVNLYELMIALLDPTAATILSPDNDSVETSLTVDLKWVKGYHSDYSEVYMGTAPDSLELLTTDVAGTGYTTDQLEPITTYYWQIKQVNSIDYDSDNVWSLTSDSDIWSFTTGHGAELTQSKIEFIIGSNGDPAANGTNTDWTESNGSYKKTTDPKVSSYGVGVDATGNLVVNLETTTESSNQLFISKTHGIGISGNSKDDINKDEVLSVSFDQEVIFSGFELVAFSGESADFRIGDGEWVTTTDGVVSGYYTVLPAGSAFELKLTDSTGTDQFRLLSMDVIASANNTESGDTDDAGDSNSSDDPRDAEDTDETGASGSFDSGGGGSGMCFIDTLMD